MITISIGDLVFAIFSVAAVVVGLFDHALRLAFASDRRAIDGVI